MHTHRRWIAIALGMLLAASATAQYTVTILHPASGYSSTLALSIDAAGQAGWGFATSGFWHALYWSGSSVTDLNPIGYSYSQAFCTSGNTQGGVGSPTGQGIINKAMIWHGTAASAVNLHPAGFTESEVQGVSGNVQVGDATGAGTQHAMMWTGTAASAVDLNPPGYANSIAYSVSGNMQVGMGDGHALIWTGSASSAVNIHPTGFANSTAQSVAGNRQGGWGQPTGSSYHHALLWSGSAASAVDLHPSGFNESIIWSISNTAQVGWGHGSVTGGDTIDHALVWFGTPGSVIDLHSFLSGLTVNGSTITATRSYAYGVDDNGDIVGEVDDSTGNFYAIAWHPTRTISGSVVLQNFAGSLAGMLITVEVRTPGSTNALDTQIVQLDGSGNFSMTTSVAPGVYDIAVKASHWLRVRLSNQVVGMFGASGISSSLVNGDVNGDNAVTLGDFAQLRAAFSSSSGDPNWNPNADLNGDGAVTLGDFAILRSRFGQQGDP